jgi:5-methylcytosine-specific restriction enzyme B
MDDHELLKNEQLWDEFLQIWPIERLKSMTLEEYTSSGANDSFTYWMEAKLANLGSIWGGSSFKFGIYSRRDKSHKQSGGGSTYSENYAWYTKYGNNEQEAFKKVRDLVVQVAEAAARADLEAIEEIDLGEVYKWKIAFHYQPRKHLSVINVFMKAPLAHHLKIPFTRSLEMADLQRRVVQSKPKDESILTFSTNIFKSWRKSVAGDTLKIKLTQGAVDNGYLHFKLSDSIFPEDCNGGNTESEAGQKVSLITETGNQYETDIRAGSGNVARIRARFGSYFKDIGAKENDIITISRVSDFEYRVEKHQEGSLEVTSQNQISNNAYSNIGLNTILYGPPGTGKTFETAKYAVEICTGQVPDSREELMAKYKQLKEAGRIVFVTFHQSFSYEDFVEGIRPEVVKDGNGAVSYDVKDGVFKRISDLAQNHNKVRLNSVPNSFKNKRLFKMSLGNSLDPDDTVIYLDSINKNRILLGYGAGLDYTGCNTISEISQRFRESNSVEDSRYNITAVHYLKNEMQVGDLVIISDGNTKFRAIGEITGEYQLSDRDDDYVQMRPVKWLAVFENSLPIETIFSKRLSQMTIYLPDPTAIKWEALEELLTPGKQNYVLVIDEINRANISKVFGELITLLEGDKRIGQLNELSVSLPYSGDAFSVPDNLYIVGTMNTADRSIALLDTALRRRFEFAEMAPRPELLSTVDGVDLSKLLSTINSRIEHLYDRDHCIGHAYFMGAESLADIEVIFRRKVLPLLQEYFYDDWAKIKLILKDSVGNFVTVSQSTLDGDDEVRELYSINPNPFDQDAFLGIYQ